MKANREITEIYANEAKAVQSQVRCLVLIRKDDPCMKQVPVDPTIQINEILEKKKNQNIFSYNIKNH